MITEAVVQRALARVGVSLAGKYVLEAVLAVGGTASVYAARRPDGQRLALKVLHAELSRVPEVSDRFRREGYVANQVGPPGVVLVAEDGMDEEGSAYLVMDLLEGRTLADRLVEAGTLSADEVASHAVRILSVLERAHRRSVVHRDIKPANVFLTNDGGLTLLDFGAARLLDGSGATRSGQLLGTRGFMSPEQAGGRNQEVDARSDLWSVGATMFALLTGRCVHEGRSPQHQTALAATQPAPPVRSIAPHVSHAMAHVVDRALAFDRDARWPTAEGMRAALETRPA